MRRSGLFKLVKLLVIFKLIFDSLRRITTWAVTKTKAGKYSAYLFNRFSYSFKNLSHFRKTFIISFIVGLLSFAVFALASKTNFKPVIDSKNLVFDNTLIGFTEFSRKNDYMKPVLIIYDEESYQQPNWVDYNYSSHKSQLNNSVIQLVDEAFSNGSRHVFIDFALTGHNKDKKILLNTISTLINKFKDTAQPHHLYVVISTQPDGCMKDIDYYQRLEHSVWQNFSLENNNLFIHPVSPTVYEDEDKVIRNWNLFTVSQLQITESNYDTKQWTFLPSPQLAYHVVSSIERSSPSEVKQKLSQLPWLHSFDIDSSRSVYTSPRSQYIEHTYQTLIDLADSQQLQSYCSKSSTYCIPPKYVQRGNDVNKRIKDEDDLISKLAFKNSNYCNEKITTFVDTLQKGADNDDMMTNRIVYSMKSWTEAKRPRIEAHYDIFTPTELFNTSPNNQDWSQQYVAIGGDYNDSRDNNYATPIGSMPGVLINLNAVVSFDSFGAIGLMSPIKRFGINLIIIFFASLVFARFRVGIATLIVLASIVISIVFFHKWMFEHGMWIEFGMPLFIINIVSLLIPIIVKLSNKDQRKTP